MTHPKQSTYYSPYELHLQEVAMNMFKPAESTFVPVLDGIETVERRRQRQLDDITEMDYKLKNAAVVLEDKNSSADDKREARFTLSKIKSAYSSANIN